MQDTRGDEFTGRMLGAINPMLVEMMAAIARKDYEQRRKRQTRGIEKAISASKYQGRPIDEDLHKWARNFCGLDWAYSNREARTLFYYDSFANQRQRRVTITDAVRLSLKTPSRHLSYEACRPRDSQERLWVQLPDRDLQDCFVR